MTFYVVDTSDCSLSWSAEKEKGEKFTSRKAAERRAAELAGYEPGRSFEIAQSIAEVSCAVGAPKIKAL